MLICLTKCVTACRFLFFAVCVFVMTTFVALFFVETKNVPIEEAPFLFYEHWCVRPPPPRQQACSKYSQGPRGGCILECSISSWPMRVAS